MPVAPDPCAYFAARTALFPVMGAKDQPWCSSRNGKNDCESYYLQYDRNGEQWTVPCYYKSAGKCKADNANKLVDMCSATPPGAAGP